MARFVIRRLLLMIPLLLGVTFVTFALINLIPGSPILSLQRNNKLKPADVDRIRHELGLDKPWPVRYVDWLNDLLHGNLGVSMHNHLPVTSRILSVLPNTLLLTSTALVFALLLAVPLGIYSAVHHKTWFDRSANVFGVALYAVPSYWLALLMIILFSLKFQDWGLFSFPATGITSARNGGGFGDRVHHLILPMVALGLVQVGIWSSYIRSTMLEALQMDYVRTARSKGLGQRAVLYGHALRNAVLPLVTLIGLSIPDLFAGAVFIESIFAWNGIGLLALNAVSQRDYTMVMGTTLMFSALTMVSNLLADVFYGVLDPRIRAE